MISLKDTSHIPAPPSAVWKCFAEMDTHYLAWHPDHIAFRNIEGNFTVPHGVVYADEKIGWMRLRGKFHVVRAEKERYFEWKAGFPNSLTHTGGWFEIKPTDDNECDLIAETHFGSSARVIGPIIDRVLAAILPVDEIRRHMAKEGENLPRLIPDQDSRSNTASTTGMSERISPLA